MKLFKSLWKVIKNPKIIDQYRNLVDKLNSRNDSLERDFAALCSTNNRLQSSIEGYIEGIESGSLLEVPNKTKGDVIYYVANGTVVSDKLLKYIIATVYGDKTRCIIEITVDYYAIKNGLLYIVTEEDPDSLIHVKNPMLFDTFDLALKYVRDMSVDDIAIEVVTEFTNRKSVTIKPNTFTFPCDIGATIYRICNIEGKPIIYSEYKVIGFDIREDRIDAVVYSEDDVALEHVEIGCDRLKDNAWTFTKSE